MKQVSDLSRCIKESGSSREKNPKGVFFWSNKKSNIIGGPHCTYLSSTSLNDIPAADFCIEGEGENSINNLIQAIKGKKDFFKISGLHYRHNGKIKSGKTPHVIHDLDTVSFPARQLVDKYVYGK